jgi:hypothetical protein
MPTGCCVGVEAELIVGVDVLTIAGNTTGLVLMGIESAVSADGLGL